MRQSLDMGSLGIEEKHTDLLGSSGHSLGQKGHCLHSLHTHPLLLVLPPFSYCSLTRRGEGDSLSANCFRTTQPARSSLSASPSPCPHREGCAPEEAGVLFHSSGRGEISLGDPFQCLPPLLFRKSCLTANFDPSASGFIPFHLVQSSL